MKMFYICKNNYNYIKYIHDMKKLLLFLTILSVSFALSCVKKNNYEEGDYKKEYTYSGRSFHDSVYSGSSCIIPGRIYCAYYDMGGENIAYHDIDTINRGSGKLNPVNGTYLHSFRMKEGVDISYTKDNGIDNTSYNFIQPPMGLLYIGWTEPGEWTKYTVNVVESGLYSVSILYTSNQGGKISLAINDVDVTGRLVITSTFNEADPVDFRQWHHWNIIENIVRIQLEKGLQTLTLTTVETGQMNYAWIDFKLVQ
jgi:hypothetical protein